MKERIDMQKQLRVKVNILHIYPSTNISKGILHFSQITSKDLSNNALYKDNLKRMRYYEHAESKLSMERTI